MLRGLITLKQLHHKFRGIYDNLYTPDSVYKRTTQKWRTFHDKVKRFLGKLEVAMSEMVPWLKRRPFYLSAIDPYLTPQDYFKIGVMYHDEGSWREAINTFHKSQRKMAGIIDRAQAFKSHPDPTKVLQDNPKFPIQNGAKEFYARESYNYLQWAHFKLDEIPLAHKATQAFLDFQPDHATMAGNLKWYAKMKDENEDVAEPGALDAVTQYLPSLLASGEGEAGRAAACDPLREELNMALDDLASYKLSVSESISQVNELTETLEHCTELTGNATLPQTTLALCADGTTGVPIDCEAKTFLEKPTDGPTVIPVDRRSNLSYEEFFKEYAAKSKPVIITDAFSNLTSVPWTMEHFAKMCNKSIVTAKRYKPGATTWGRLIDGPTMYLSDFISDLEKNRTLNEGFTPIDDPDEGPLDRFGNPLLYVFDWPLPDGCPALMEEFSMPKYFAGDLLQRVPRNIDVPYRDAWPSLFIGPGGSKSALHTDSFGSSFWMALFKGRKRWVFFPPEQSSFLYEDRPHQLFAVNALKPNATEYPLLRHATMAEAILEPGELLFVPAGSPHQVENLEEIIAISGNYIDAANYKRSIYQTGLSGQAGFGGQEALYQQLLNPTLEHRASRNQQNMLFSEFKKWPRPEEEGPFTLDVRDTDPSVASLPEFVKNRRVGKAQTG
eukprot:TRINITY_DN1524_c0_g1_i1.p1 TRINITY_DN1524_c0_g1~~TRINITY_DN1524_c0_g1_i1.p1  ORF type:complete len:667 (-),score=187.12 TRINITY_DN1524_c0_g1_i1:210-2210(-)